MLDRKVPTQKFDDIVKSLTIADYIFSLGEENIEFNNADEFRRVTDILVLNSIPLLYLNTSNLSEPYKQYLNDLLLKKNNLFKSWIKGYNLLKKEFVENDIEHILIKTPSFFPYTSGNIDILVNKNNIDTVKNVLEKNRYIELKNIPEAHKWLYRKYSPKDVYPPIHLHEEVYWGGTFLDSSQIWKNYYKVTRKDLPVPSPEDLFLITLAHSFFENKGIRILDLLIIKQLITNNKLDWEYMETIVDKYKWIEGYHSSIILYEKIHNSLSNKNLFGKEILLRSKNYISKNLFLNRSINNISFKNLRMPFNLPFWFPYFLWVNKNIRSNEQDSFLTVLTFIIHDALTSFLRIIFRITHQESSLITISGVDGSGKTTFAHGLNQAFNTMGIRTKYVWHRPGVPKILSFIKKNTSKQYDYKYDHTNKSSILNNKYIKFIYITYNLFYLCIYYNLKLRYNIFKKKVIICDRYITDFLIDFSIINDNKYNGTISKLLSYLLPKPIIICYMKVSPEIAYNRQKEEKYEKLINANKKYQNMFINKKYITINSNKKMFTMLYKNVHSILNEYYKGW